MTDRETVHLEQGFILHRRPYKNTSQLIDCLTKNYGVITLVAQGSRRVGSDRRVVLQSFSSLQLSCLTHAEVVPPSLSLSGEAILAGFYLNELLLRLMGRGDPNALVFSCYSRCLSDLSDLSNTSRTLRVFELRFLDALGYGLGLLEDVETGEAICSEGTYGFESEHGFTMKSKSDSGLDVFSGRELISLREERLDDLASLKAAKRLLGYVLRIYLGNRPLSTRTVLQDVYARGLES
jgi:DNA repair protein RecO (recombination protein O)